MKKILLVCILLYNITTAQNMKYQIETSLIWSDHFSRMYTESPLIIGNVKKFHSLSLRDFKVNGQINITNRNSIGFGLFNQEFEYGYTPSAVSASGNLTIVTGMRWSHYYKRIMQWNAELFDKYYFISNKKNKFYFQVGAQFGYLPFSKIYLDTNYYGHNYWERAQTFTNTKYIKFPAYQDNKVKFLVGTGMGIEHNISNHFGYAFSLFYRQGFDPIFIDDTRIYVNYWSSQKKFNNFRTKITGTSWQLNYTLIYKFGKLN